MCPGRLGNIPDMPACEDKSVTPDEIDPSDLAALEQLVRYGLADVVTIDGEPVSRTTRSNLVSSPGQRRSRQARKDRTSRAKKCDPRVRPLQPTVPRRPPP